MIGPPRHGWGLAFSHERDRIIWGVVKKSGPRLRGPVSSTRHPSPSSGLRIPDPGVAPRAMGLACGGKPGGPLSPLLANIALMRAVWIVLHYGPKARV